VSHTKQTFNSKFKFNSLDNRKMLGKELPRVPSNSEDSRFFHDNECCASEVRRQHNKNPRNGCHQQPSPITCRPQVARQRSKKSRWPLNSLFLSLMFLLLLLQGATCQRSRRPTQRPGPHRRVGPQRKVPFRPTQPQKIFNLRELNARDPSISNSLRVFRTVCKMGLDAEDPQSLRCLIEMLKEAQSVLVEGRKSRRNGKIFKWFRGRGGKYDDLYRLLDPGTLPRRSRAQARKPTMKPKSPQVKKRQVANVELHHISSSFPRPRMRRYFAVSKNRLEGVRKPNKYSLIEIRPAKGSMTGMEFVTLRGVYSNKFICIGKYGRVQVKKNTYQSDGAPKCVFTRRRTNLRNPVYSYVARRVKNRMYWFLAMTRGGKIKRKTMPYTVSDRSKNSGGFKFYELNVTRTTS